MLNVLNKGGLPGSGIGAVALNLTVVEGVNPTIGGGFVTVYPCGARPDASNLNFTTGQTIPNSVIAPVSAGGDICFFVYGTAHLLADISGYFPTALPLPTTTTSASTTATTASATTTTAPPGVQVEMLTMQRQQGTMDVVTAPGIDSLTVTKMTGAASGVSAVQLDQNPGIGFRVEAAQDAALGQWTLFIEGTGCVGPTCSPYRLTINVIVTVPGAAADADLRIVNPSADRVADALPRTAGVAMIDEITVVLGTADIPGTRSDADSAASLVGGVVVGGIEGLGIFQILVPNATVEAAILQLEALAWVIDASPSVVGDQQLHALPPGDWDDDGVAVTWPFLQINAPRAWDISTGDSVPIGIVDGGEAYAAHPDLRVVSHGSGLAEAHATHVAGLACAAANGTGVVGVAWGCPILSTGVTATSFGGGRVTDYSSSSIIDGVWELLNRTPRPKVINVSMGSGHGNPETNCGTTAEMDSVEAEIDADIIEQASALFRSPEARSVLFTLSAGNSCVSRTVGPLQTVGANYDNVLIVAATNSDGSLWRASNYGVDVDVAAPGGVLLTSGSPGYNAGIWSTSVNWAGDDAQYATYEQKQGTSMAAPIVAGVGALVRAANPALTATQSADCIRSSAFVRGDRVTRGASPPFNIVDFTPVGDLYLVDAAGAVECAQSTAGVTRCRPSRVSQAECDALLALYDAANGPNWTTNTGWATNTDPCTWYGITCNLTSIRYLQLAFNQLSGSIPTSLSKLTNLEVLNLMGNQLSGSIPISLGNISSLRFLQLCNNQLSGSIPTSLDNLTNLNNLFLCDNQLSGSIPTSLGDLTNLNGLALDDNQLSGSIPTSLGNLTNLNSLGLGGNQLSGSIPTSLGSLTNLNRLGMEYNQLSGSIPTSLGDLTNLTYLNLRDNQLSGSIPTSLGDLTNLSELQLGGNQLSGSIPTSLGNLTNLESLYLFRNQLSGSIPTSLGNLTNLAYLNLRDNQLSGSIPTSLGNLANLRYMYLGGNQLSGSIPTTLGDLSNLVYLELGNNQLSGSIPTSLGDLANLQFLYLYLNQLSGSIPTSLGNLTNLRYMYLYLNQLSGSIPTSLGDLTNLEALELRDNQLSGSIPTTLGDLTNLELLDLADNQLSGDITSLTSGLIASATSTTLLLRGNGCLTVTDATLAIWLNGKDAGWNDGCP